MLCIRHWSNEIPLAKLQTQTMSIFASKQQELGVVCRCVDSNMPESVSNRPDSLVEQTTCRFKQAQIYIQSTGIRGMKHEPPAKPVNMSLWNNAWRTTKSKQNWNNTETIYILVTKNICNNKSTNLKNIGGWVGYVTSSFSVLICQSCKLIMLIRQKSHLECRSGFWTKHLYPNIMKTPCKFTTKA